MATHRPALSQRDQAVTISVDPSGNVRVDHDTIPISKQAHEEVHWQADPPNLAFKVVVNNSPFHYPDFDSDNPYSGEVHRELKVPPNGIYYKYTVTVGANSIDPGVIVNP